MSEVERKDRSHWIQTFDTEQGVLVLKELLNYCDGGGSWCYKANDEVMLAHGRKQVLDYIKESLRASCKGQKQPYADLFFRVECL